ncbi:MAG: aminodeoxychorismate lyase, partial [Rhodococcus sp. (in: high G+C Gram-positive bacteria)]
MNYRRYENDAHTDPIGYSVGQGSEFDRAVVAGEPRPTRRAQNIRRRAARSRKRRGQLIGAVLGLVLLVAVASGGYFVFDRLSGGPAPAEDFAAGNAG